MVALILRKIPQCIEIDYYELLLHCNILSTFEETSFYFQSTFSNFLNVSFRGQEHQMPKFELQTLTFVRISATDSVALLSTLITLIQMKNRCLIVLLYHCTETGTITIYLFPRKQLVCSQQVSVSTNLQGGHGTGKTGNLVLTFSRQGKHREFCFDTGKNFETQGKYFSVTQGKI